jgi:hypothetical protein
MAFRSTGTPAALPRRSPSSPCTKARARDERLRCFTLKKTSKEEITSRSNHVVNYGIVSKMLPDARRSSKRKKHILQRHTDNRERVPHLQIASQVQILTPGSPLSRSITCVALSSSSSLSLSLQQLLIYLPLSAIVCQSINARHQKKSTCSHQTQSLDRWSCQLVRATKFMQILGASTR